MVTDDIMARISHSIQNCQGLDVSLYTQTVNWILAESCFGQILVLEHNDLAVCIVSDDVEDDGDDGSDEVIKHTATTTCAVEVTDQRVQFGSSCTAEA